MDSESDFYGDEDTVTDLESRLNEFDVEAWMNSRLTFNAPMVRQQEAEEQQRRLKKRKGNDPEPSSQSADTKPLGRLHNRYEGEPLARQLTESVEDFLERLPPSTTDWRPGFDWIYIANPYIPAPQQGPAMNSFMKGGQERLRMYVELTDMIETASGKPASQIQRDVHQERVEAVQDLQALAVACNFVTGKWMLFPDPAHVDDVWARVAHATARNELGIGAKVETRGDAASKKARLICIYTKDYRDKGDVARVLNRLRELELVKAGPGNKQIYYKTGWSKPLFTARQIHL